MDDILDRFRARIQAASADGSALLLRGGGSKDWYGQHVAGDVLDTRAHAGVVGYEPTELVLTARCGTALAEIEALLAANGQMLAFEPPRFGAGSTIGGVVASGLSGPRRASAGALRDFVLGAQLMDGRGELLSFGGQVMKNVAGYDVARLLAGSLGSLGLITEVSLKVLPLPLCEETIRFEIDEITALRWMNEWAGRPLPVSATCWHGGLLSVRLSGAQAALRAALTEMGGERLADGAAFWTALRDQQDRFFAAAQGGETELWRLSVPSAASALVLRGEQLIEWGGAQRWLRVERGVADDIRRVSAAAGGHATRYRAQGRELGAGAGAFHPLAPAVARIHERIKAAFDPAGIFNRGRMY
ncbi:MAG: glcE [Pseudoduganella sp.]|jgi:glycolate oxidase FAD binding subunit|nr:glcE [Pseudoduganella sp.]